MAFVFKLLAFTPYRICLKQQITYSVAWIRNYNHNVPGDIIVKTSFEDIPAEAQLTLGQDWVITYNIFNTLRPTQNGWHLADDIFKCIFLNENTSISINISLKFVPDGRINNIPALVQIITWRRSDDKPLSEPMMVSLLTHICVTRPQWVNVDVITNPHNDHNSMLNLCY